MIANNNGYLIDKLLEYDVCWYVCMYVYVYICIQSPKSQASSLFEQEKSYSKLLCFPCTNTYFRAEYRHQSKL